MTCLHLCNGFFGNKVHKNLYNELEKIGIKQIVYASMHKKYIGSEKISDLNYQIIVSDLLLLRHKIFFRFKINNHVKKIKSQCDLKTINLIHATTLFTDGAIAYKLSKSFNIPYIINIRETDIGIFLKYRPDLLILGLNILKKAKKVVFVSEASKNRFFTNIFIRIFAKNLVDNTMVLSNAVDSYWLNNQMNKKEVNPFKIIYIGRFQKRKNILRLMDAVLKVKLNLPEIQLNIIGKSGIDEKEVIRYADKYPETIKYLGYINEKDKLRDLLRDNHIFAMPSYAETFGLVYIEALTQGLPILYSKGAGVDGIFSDFKVGEAVNPKSTESIIKGLNNILANYKSYDLKQINFKEFNWVSRAQHYFELYNTFFKYN